MVRVGHLRARRGDWPLRARLGDARRPSGARQPARSCEKALALFWTPLNPSMNPPDQIAAAMRVSQEFGPERACSRSKRLRERNSGSNWLSEMKGVQRVSFPFALSSTTLAPHREHMGLLFPTRPTQSQLVQRPSK